MMGVLGSEAELSRDDWRAAKRSGAVSGRAAFWEAKRSCLGMMGVLGSEAELSRDDGRSGK